MEDYCPICLEQSSDMFVLTCKHRVHLECCEGLNSHNCPICRSKIENFPQEVIQKINSNIEKYLREKEEDALEAAIELFERDITSIDSTNEAILFAIACLLSLGIPQELIPPADIEIDQITMFTPSMIFYIIVSETIIRVQEILSEGSSISSSEEE